MAERVVLEVDETPAVKGTQRANAELEKYEKRGVSAVANISKGFEQQGERVVRVTDRSRNSVERLVAAVEKQALVYGKTGVERLIAQKEQLIQRLGNEQAAVERATKAYDQMIAEEKKLGSGVAKFGDGVKNFIQNPLQAAGDAAGNFFSKIGPVGAGIGIAAAGFGIAAKAAWGFAKDLAQIGDQAEDTAFRMGLTIREEEAFRFAMKRAGGDMAQFEMISRQLSREIDGGGKSLRDMGVDFRDVRTGAVLPMSEVILNLSRRLKEIPDTSERNTAAIKVLGRSALEVLPDLMELEAGVKRFDELSVGVTDEQVRKFGEYQKRIAEIEAQWEKLKIAFKEKVVGVVSIVTGISTKGSPEDTRWGNLQDVGYSARNRAIENEIYGVFGRPQYPTAGDAGGYMTGVSVDRGLVARNDAAVAAALGDTPQDRLAAARAELNRLRGELKTGVLPQVNTETLKSIAIERDKIAAIEAEIEATKRLKEERKALADGTAKLNEAMGGDALDRQLRMGAYNPSKNRTNLDALAAQQAEVALEFGMREYAAGRTPRQSGEAFGAWAGGFTADRTAGEQRSIAALERELRLNEELIRLRTGPGGERDAIEETYALRVKYAEQEFAIHMDQARFQEQMDEAHIDRIREMATEERRRFDEIRNSVESTIDAMISRSRSAFEIIGGIFQAAILTPIKRAASAWVTGLLMPMSARSGGASGFAGALGSAAMGFGMPGAAAAAPAGLGQLSPLLYPGAAAALGGGAGSPAPAGGRGGLLNLGAFAGMGGLLFNSGSIAMGAGTATTAAGIGGFGGTMAGIASSPAALLGGGLLAAYGIRRGGWMGSLMGIGGGALAGFALGAKIGSIGGPWGMAIGAGIGGAAALIRSLFKTAEEKAREKIQALYGVRMEDKGVLRQIVETAKSGFGGNLDMAIRSPQIRDLIELYALTTGQRGMAAANVMRPASMYQAGGSLYNMPSYSNGSPLPAAAAPAGGSAYTLQLDPEATREFLEGRQVRAIERNPRVVASANLAATRQNYARRENAALALSPGSLTA